MTSGTTKQRRKIFTRAPIDHEPQLTTRDHHILMAIRSYRLLTSPQLTTLFWPPSIDHKLKKWGIDSGQAQAIMEQKSAAYLDELIELLKWLRKINKISASDHLSSSADKKLQAWLKKLEQHHLLPSSIQYHFAKHQNTGDQ